MLGVLEHLQQGAQIWAFCGAACKKIGAQNTLPLPAEHKLLPKFERTSELIEGREQSVGFTSRKDLRGVYFGVLLEIIFLSSLPK
jgi:hypothetical protein